MKILLTGSTGFVGSHLAKAFLQDEHSVCILKRSYSNIWRIKDIINQCAVYNVDETTIEQIFENEQIDCIVHCATHYGRNDKECDKNIEVNLLFPLRILSLGVEKGVKYFINTDTFFTKQLMWEESLDNELYMGGYTLSKMQFRQWGRMFATKYGINFINMELEHVYGEYDDESKFIPYLLRTFSSNKEAIALSEGIQLRDFIHISDVVEAYRLVIGHLENNKDITYKTYEVGTGRMRSLREFVEILHEAVHSTTALKWGETPMKKGELMQSRADNKELLKIGWQPQVVENEDIKLKLGGV